MGKPFNYRFFVFCGTSIALGIILSAAFSIKNYFIIVLPPLVLAALALVAFLVTDIKAILIHALVFVILYFIGAISISIGIDSATAYIPPEVESGNEMTIKGYVSECIRYYPESDTTKVLITDLSDGGNDLKSASAIAFVDGRAEIGDKVSVSGVAEKTVYPEIDLFYFPRRAVLEFKSDRHGKILQNGGGFFYSVRKYIRNSLKTHLNDRSYSFVAALILGETDELSFNELDNLRSAGISHVFAVSGLHVGFLAAFVSFLLNLIKIRRFKNAVLVFIITLLYAGVCGFPISAIRAAIMCFVFGTARSFGLKGDNLNAVFLSMTAVLIIFPQWLFSLGFILSFAAVTGIALFGNMLKTVFSFLTEKLALAFSVSMSAFIATAPVIVYVLGKVSLITVLTNVVVIPIVTVLYYISTLSLILTSIIESLSVSFVVVNALTEFLTETLSAVDFGKFVSLGSFTPFSTAFYYFNLVITSDKINANKGIKIISAVAAAASALLLV